MKTASEYVRSVVPGDVQSAMETLGLAIVRIDGDELYTHCPAHVALTGHTDNNPSFSVNSETGMYFCFSCHYAGGWLTLAADMLNVGRGEAETWTRAQGTIGASRRRLERAKAGPQAITTIVSRAALALFEPPPEHMLAERRLTAAACADYGILWDPKSRAWIMPIRDAAGRLLGWQSKTRAMVRNYPADSVRKAESIFGLHLPSVADAVLVENPLKAARLHGSGLAPGCLALYGSKASEKQIELLAARGRRLILFLDHDPAGWSGAKLLYAALRGRVVVLTVTYDGLERGVDPGDLTDEQIAGQLAGAVSPIRRRWPC